MIGLDIQFRTILFSFIMGILYYNLVVVINIIKENIHNQFLYLIIISILNILYFSLYYILLFKLNSGIINIYELFLFIIGTYFCKRLYYSKNKY